MTLTIGSLFSGAAGFEQGFEQAGFRTAWQCEIDKDATDVLERHYPNVQRFRDVRDIDPATLDPVDVVVFGSPCQDMSVAGSRAGLDGERSGLFYEAVRIISGLRPTPTFCIWENVPGALSSAGGRDFGSVLDSLADIGALDISWRVLDAQWFGVPQRRRRIFLVADFAGERAAQILFESESLSGHPETSREAWQGSAGDAESGAGSGAGSGGTANTLRTGGYGNGTGSERGDGCDNLIPSTAYTLAASARGTGDGHGNAWNSTYVPVSVEAVAHCLNTQQRGVGDPTAETFIVAGTLGATDLTGNGNEADFLVAAFDERQITSKANRSTVERGADGPTLDGSGGMSVVGFKWQQGENAGSLGIAADESPTLGTTQVPAVAFKWQSAATAGLSLDTTSPALGTTQTPASHDGMSVRRLTPRECERLMGWPDDHTRYRADGSEIPDGPRYRLCGNGVVAPVAYWLANRVRAALEAT